MKIMKLGLCVILFMGLITGASAQQEKINADQQKLYDEISQLKWQKGPGVGAISDKATINIPEGGGFLNAAEAEKYEILVKNLPQGEEYILVPKDFSWEAHFQFSSSGYVKDDEKLDPASLLETLKSQQISANQELKRRGWPTMTILGWYLPPQYDPSTHVLEWAINLQTEGSNTPTVNYFTKILGRKGLTDVTVAMSAETFNQELANFKNTLPGFQYAAGERYADYVPGDRVSEYGLAALVTGGVVAVAANKGVFATLAAFFVAAWKLVIAGVIPPLLANTKSGAKRRVQVFAWV